MTLIDWQRHGWLTPHQTSRQEIAGLLAITERDLEDSTHRELSPDWQLNIAYNAALQVARAALAASGYRTARSGSEHYRTIESLRLTVGLDASTIQRLDAFQRRRNISEYDRAGSTSGDEAEEMRGLAACVRDEVVRWLEERHPQLLG